MNSKKSVEEISKQFNVSRTAMYNWLKAGLKHSCEKVIGIKVRIIIDPDDVVLFHKSLITKKEV